MRSHKDSREFEVSLPWVHHLLGGESLQVYERQVHKSLYKSEIPTIAESKPVIYIFLTNAIDEVTKEEPRRANKELLPFGTVRQRNPKQRPGLILATHVYTCSPSPKQPRTSSEKANRTKGSAEMARLRARGAVLHVTAGACDLGCRITEGKNQFFLSNFLFKAKRTKKKTRHRYLAAQGEDGAACVIREMIG